MKEIIQCATLGIPNGMKKMQFLFLLLDFLFINENITSKECKTKNRF